MSVLVKPITSKIYQEFYEATQTLIKPPLFLPKQFSDKLWGVVAYKEEIIIGGWIGHKRGDYPIIKNFTQGVWFDSFPIVFNTDEKEIILLQVVSSAKELAQKDGIVLFSITHWSREILEDTSLLQIPQKNATFIVDLSLGVEALWKNLKSKLRNMIRKAEKNDVIVFKANGEEALNYLADFQELRATTQQRAIGKNKRASMLLKSNEYFKNVLRNNNASFFVAMYNNQIAAMALMVQTGNTTYYYSGGSNIELNKLTAASSLLIWKAIEISCQEGLSFFDLGGVPLNPTPEHPAYGVYLFKQGYGGEYKEYDSGKIIVCKWKYKLLRIVLDNKIVLRFVSKNE